MIGRGDLGADRAIYIISVAAELAGVHPQTLRIYERKGLLTPERTQGNTRRYSERDITRLKRIQELTSEGLNLAGVMRTMELEDEIQDLRGRYESALQALEEVETRMREAAGTREHNAMVLFKDVRRVRRAMKADELERAGRRRVFPLPPISLS